MKSVDTIFALSSGSLPSGVALVRVSGPHVRAVLETMTGGVPEPRQARLRAIRSVEGELLDRGLVIYFPGARSFVGEDTAELHLHGGKAVVAAVLRALGRITGLRSAEPGEFTRRAFLNGKVDLLEAEALADLVKAETEFQRRLAQDNAGGAQAALYLGWRQRLIRARAMIEAAVDFSDEEDVPPDVATGIWADLHDLSADIDRHISGFQKAEIIRDGLDVVIVGPPNAGKSSLLNRLAQRDVAIVTEEPGTTRDLLEVALDLDERKVRLTDTAGIRTPEGRVEAIGIERAMRRAEQADLVLRLQPADDVTGAQSHPPLGVPVLDVISKADLDGEGLGPAGGLRVSVLTGEGIDGLIGFLGSAAREATDTSGRVLPTRLRHIELLGEARGWLGKAVAGGSRPIELRAEELRLAAHALGRISGAVDVEDLLDVIFAEFCIGK
jgi:tRNA modification GTPase